MDFVKVKIKSKEEGLTIKDFLKEAGVGRAKIEELRVGHSTFINEKNVNLEYKLKKDEELSFTFDEKIDFIPEHIKLNVVYEDDYLLLVEKTYGILIHPENKNGRGTLVNYVAGYYVKNNIKRKVRYIHRLDFETTGIVIFAKDFLSEAYLNKMMEKGKIERDYLALVKNTFSKKEGTINTFIGRDRHDNHRYRVSKTGKRAITHYQVLDKIEDNTLVRLTLETGRTHQLRVHMNYLNHPIIGDSIYGQNENRQLCLYAYEVKFYFPLNCSYIDIKLPIPSWFYKKNL